MVKSQKIEKTPYLYLILTAVAFVILLLTLYPYKPNFSKLSALPTPTPTLPPIENEWKIYHDDKYAFEFQYPSSLKLILQNIDKTKSQIKLADATTDQDIVVIEYLPSFSCPKESCQLLLPQTIGNNIFVPIQSEIGQSYIVNSKYRIWVNTNNQKYIDVVPRILSSLNFFFDSKYTCPDSEWVDCMPGPNQGIKLECTPEALNWFKLNCPNFKGAAL